VRRLEGSRFLVKPGKRVRLASFDPADTTPFTSDVDGKQLLKQAQKRLFELTEILYAQDRWSLLLIFQAMDAAGKDSAIKHVMRGVDPKATQVFTFKAPSAEELDHDFMWRCLKVLPERGRIGVFNRSYYEEVLVVRVHPDLLERQHLPRERITRRIWTERFEDIRDIERYLSRNGTIIRKFFFNLSRRSSANGSWPGSMTRRRTGSSRSATSMNASSGTSTCAPTRRRSRRRAPRPPRGMSSRPTTSGTPAWSSPRSSSRRSKAWRCTFHSSIAESAGSWARLGDGCARLSAAGHECV
jgi:polyphosphate kinase 2 (PPK2 family)